MAFYNQSGSNGDGNGVFDTGSGKIGDKDLDVASKLSILFKRGVGSQYVKNPDKLDAPLIEKHKQFLNAQFKKVTYNHFVQTMMIEVDRRRSFQDFNTMDYTPEISSALDIYADESLTKDEFGDILTINSDNERIKSILDNLFDDVLSVNDNLWHWIRSTCKYGDHFTLLDVQENKGVVGYLDLKAQEMRREEAFDDKIKSVKFIWDAGDTTFDHWQIAHFRLTEDQSRMPYGTSQIESARLIWKQLQLSEDAMIIYRITRAPERRVFYIDVGSINPADVDNYIEEIKHSIKRTPQVTESTGNIDFRYHSMAPDEDFFIPRRNDKNSEIDTLPGASNLDDIADIEYLQAKLFAALKIPKAYLTFDEDINAKATLATEDVRFARTINRIQQSIIATLNHIAIVHLFALGFRDKDQLTEFTISLTNPSTQSEIEKLELWDQKATVFSNMWDETTLSPISWVWGMKNIFNFSDDEIKAIAKQQFIEGKMKRDIEDEAIGVEFQGQFADGATTGATAGVTTENIGIMLEHHQAYLKTIAPTHKNNAMINNTLSPDNSVRMLESLAASFGKDSTKPTELLA
jgi:hypothetical protein